MLRWAKDFIPGRRVPILRLPAAAAQPVVVAEAVQPAAAAAAAWDSTRLVPSRRQAPPAPQAVAAVAVAVEAEAVAKDHAVTRPAQAAAAPW